MINYVNKALFNDDSVDKQLKLTFSGGDVITNADIDAESMKLVESINSGSELVFGSCEASEFEITIRNVYSSHVGQTVTVSMVLDGDTANPFTFGTYKVIEDKATADRLKREIRAYDSMYDILNTDVSAWYNSLYPTSATTKTVKQIRDSLFTHFGITQEVVTLPNDSVVVGKTISPTSLSGKDVLMALCEINARFGHIGRDGVFNYIRLQEMITGLYPRNDLYPDDDLYPADEVGSEDIGVQGNYISAKYEEYTVDHIDKLVIRQEDTDIGCVVGSGTNDYIIQGNFLVYGKSAADLTTIANAIKDDIFGVWYRPCEVEVRGNPCLEVGDGIRLNTSYEIVYSYIFKRTLSGIQFLRDDFYADGLKQRNEQVNSVQTQMKQLVGKTASIKADVDEVSATLTEQLDDTVQGSYAYQTAQEIGLKVSKNNIVTDLDNAMSSSITITPNNINIASSGALTIATAQFTLAANGNATFGGSISGATISGGTIANTPYSYESGTYRTQIGSSGLTASNGNNFSSVAPGTITVSDGINSCVVAPTGATKALSVANGSYAARVSAAGNLIPDVGGMYCGTAGNPWQGVYGVNAYVETSDRNKKKNISEIPANYLDFVLKLAPKLYQFKDGSSGRFHVGFIAQDVEETMSECGISDIEFAGLVKDEGYYGLRYTEFIGLLTLAIQHQEQRLTSLEERISRLEMKNNE